MYRFSRKLKNGMPVKHHSTKIPISVNLHQLNPNSLLHISVRNPINLLERVLGLFQRWMDRLQGRTKRLLLLKKLNGAVLRAHHIDLKRKSALQQCMQTNTSIFQDLGILRTLTNMKQCFTRIMHIKRRQD